MHERIQRIQEALELALFPAQIDIQDDSAAHSGHAGAISHGGGHFTATIVSEAFAEKSMVRRHQMVYQALGNLMQTDIHALVIRAYTPSEIQ